MIFKTSEALSILFEEGFERLGDEFIELVSNKADSTAHKEGDGLESFVDGFELGEAVACYDEVFVQREGQYAWYFIGTEFHILKRIKQALKKRLGQ